MLNKLLINGETIYFDKNDKFKTASVSMFTFFPFTETHASERHILASILSNSNEIYKVEKDFNAYCQELYDVYFSFKNTRLGRTGLFNSIVTFVNPSYVDEGKELLFNILNLIITSYLMPDITKEKVEREKNILYNEIMNIYNNKNQYAYQKFMENMFKDELISKKVNGTLDSLDNVTLDSVIKTYQEILKCPRIFYITGDIKEEDINEFFGRIHLPIVSNDLSIIEFIDKETKEVENVNEVIEEQNISQSILFMGYRSNITLKDDLYIPMCVFSSMLGGSFHSTLFRVIREENSLAYSVSSDYNGRKGHMVVTAGIDKSKYNEVVELVNKVMDDYKQGRIELETLELTKMIIINNTIKGEDSANSSLYQVYNDLANIHSLTLDEKIEMVNNVSLDDIVKVANLIKLDTIYFLKGTLENDEMEDIDEED